MNTVELIRQQLKNAATISPDRAALFFKTAPGGYAHHDQFLGITVPTIRLIARNFYHVTTNEIAALLAGQYNEERLCALIILVHKYNKADALQKEELYQFYCAHMQHVNNWNLVDSSAHLIIGAHLVYKDRSSLITLAHSKNLWERRIAIVATWWFIRNNDLEWTFKIAILLLKDSQDLIQKAVGWMLREAGKRDQQALLAFLETHGHQMPRTALRYAIERLPADIKQVYVRPAKAKSPNNSV